MRAARERATARTAAGRLAGLPVLELEGGLRVHEARTWRARRDGLARLEGLPPDLGLWIAPCRSIHTFGMAFPIDLIWLDRQDRILAVEPGVGRRRVRARRGARSVIEVAGGHGERFAAAWRSRP